MKTLNFGTAFKYPFNRPKGLLNIFWIFLPIIGLFTLYGYGVRIVQEFLKGKFKELPIVKFKDDTKLGFFMFLKSIPFIVAYIIVIILLELISPWVSGIGRLLIDLFILPILTVNFMKKQTVNSYFEFAIVKHVFQNFGDYIIMILKAIGLGIVFLVMWIVLVGLPAGMFTYYIFIADFYRRRVK